MKTIWAAALAAILVAAAPQAAHADRRAQEIVKRMNATTLAVHSLTADFYEEMTVNGQTDRVAGKITLMRPLCLRMDFWRADAAGHPLSQSPDKPHEILASDGATYWEIGRDGTTVKEPAKTTNVGTDNALSAAQRGAPTAFGCMFFDPAQTPPADPSVRCSGVTRFDGVACRRLVDVEPVPGGSQIVHFTTLVGPDNIVREDIADGGKTYRFVLELSDVKVDAPLKASSFAFAPPAWARSKSVTVDVPGVHMDARSAALLKAAEDKMLSLRSLSAQYTRSDRLTQPKARGGRWTLDIHLGTVDLMRPNLARITYGGTFRNTKKTLTDPTEIQDSNGTTYWDLYDPAKKLYESQPVAEDGKNINLYQCELLRGFFDPSDSFYADPAGKGWNQAAIRYGGPAIWQRQRYQTVVEHVASSFDGDTLHDTSILFIGADGLVHRQLDHGQSSTGATVENDEFLTDLRLDPPLPRSDFAFKLPAGATEKAQFAFEDKTPSLADGAAAPDFTVYDRDGKPVHLSDFKGKVVVLDFWATWCEPCQMSLPNTEKVAQKNPGVVFLAVNVWDSQKAFDSWLPQHKQYGALQFAIDTSPTGKDIASSLYNVQGIPTQFVIDPSGKIVKSFVGYDPDTSGLQAAIEAAGAGTP